MGEIGFNIVEIFESIDGEGKRTGELATFIRLAGCNLNCSYCDTNYAKDSNCGEFNTISQILDRVKLYDTKNVTLTGGEPLSQFNVNYLLEALEKAGYKVNVETNGSIPLYLAARFKNVFYTMDYKCPSSGMEESMDLQNLEFLDEDDVLKFVVGNEEDLTHAHNILTDYNIRAQVYLSPVFGKIEPVEIVNYMKSHSKVLGKARVQVQLHKIIWNPDERGV